LVLQGFGLEGQVLVNITTGYTGLTSLIESSTSLLLFVRRCLENKALTYLSDYCTLVIAVIGHVTIRFPIGYSYLLFQTYFRYDAPFSHNTYVTDSRQTDATM